MQHILYFKVQAVSRKPPLPLELSDMANKIFLKDQGKTSDAALKRRDLTPSSDHKARSSFDYQGLP